MGHKQPLSAKIIPHMKVLLTCKNGRDKSCTETIGSSGGILGWSNSDITSCALPEAFTQIMPAKTYVRERDVVGK